MFFFRQWILGGQKVWGMLEFAYGMLVHENPVPKRRLDHHIPVIPAYSTELHSNLLRQFERGPVSTGVQLSLRRVVTDYFVVCRETLTVHTLKTRGNGCPTHLKTDMAGMRRETDWWVGK